MGIRKCINTITNEFIYNFPARSCDEPSEGSFVRIFDTSMGSLNAGDYIIMHYCNLVLEEIFGKDVEMQHVPTHVRPSASFFSKNADYSVFCGTNILHSNMQEQNMWKLPLGAAGCKEICGLGLGWNCYEESPLSRYTRRIFDEVFSSKLIHSVRDMYTYNKLVEHGYENVIFTACPTMWQLDKERCAKVPSAKGKAVVTTVTDYNRDYVNDARMLEVLKSNYEKVYIWIQGGDDKEYLSSVCDISSCELIDSTYEAYTRVLERVSDLDFVGTRLHAGIHALNYGHRAIVVAIDNRAREIAKDTKLPIVQRNNIVSELESMINSEFVTDIKLPFENINRWKEQFKP